MALESRRSFNQKMLGSFMAYGLIETLFARDLFGDTVRPVIHEWLSDLNELGRDLKSHKLKDVEFQGKLEELYKKVDLAELIKLVDLDRLTRGIKYPERGAASLGMDFSMVEGLPKKLVFGKQIFAVKKGRSIVPHGHENMCTGFVILRGDFQGKHYDKVEEQNDFYLIKPTIDRLFKPAEFSTISDHKDNIHWFKAESEVGCIFNIHVSGYDSNNPNVSGRRYLDPEGEKLAGGLIRARKVSSTECHKKYG